jgi:hypothetical protein
MGLFPFCSLTVTKVTLNRRLKRNGSLSEVDRLFVRLKRLTVKRMIKMVTAISKSRSNGSVELTEKELARIQGEHAKAADIAVGAAIKARNESFASLAMGAAHAVWFYAKYGRTDYINKLFIGLLNGPSATDASNLRTMYLPKLIALYGAGGQKDPADETKWLKRNTPFVTFSTDGEKDGNYFRPASFKDDDIRSKHVVQGKAAVAAETVETLASISWKEKVEIVQADRAFDREAWLKGLKRELIKGARATGDAESMIDIATIEQVMRDLGMSKSMKAEIRDAFAEQPGKPVVKEGEKTEIPAEHKSQENQVAA